MAIKKDIAFDDCSYSGKYDKMGVNPLELYFRQNSLCYLMIDKKTKSILCTDGKETGITSKALNPTYECMECLTKFLKDLMADNEMQNKIDRTIFLFLEKIAEARVIDKDVSLYMTMATFDLVEEYINSTTLSTDSSKPLRISAAGDIFLFGAKVIFISDIDKGLIMVEPGKKSIRV